MSQAFHPSIVIPTHNRKFMLSRCLTALSHQTYPANEFEVIVVADACNDGTAAMVLEYSHRSPFRLILLEHSAKSAAATRNLGANEAHGKILLFLDDDIIPQPGLLIAHLEAQHKNRIVLGYSKPVVPEHPSWWQYDARLWWENHYKKTKDPGYRFCYRDFFSGNVSMSAKLFRQVGGFDTRISGTCEDYELGLRLLKAGISFHYAPNAIGFHNDFTDLPQWLLRRIKEEGIADVLIADRHPEMRNILFDNFENPKEQWRRSLRKLAFCSFKYSHTIEKRLLNMISTVEKLRFRGTWRIMVGILREYKYWCGVAITIGNKRKFVNWLQEAPMPPIVASNAPIIDIARLPSVNQLKKVLEHSTKVGLRLALEGIEVLNLPPIPGSEPLKIEHLHYALQEAAEHQFIPAMAWHKIISNIEKTSYVY